MLHFFFGTVKKVTEQTPHMISLSRWGNVSFCVQTPRARHRVLTPPTLTLSAVNERYKSFERVKYPLSPHWYRRAI